MNLSVPSSFRPPGALPPAPLAPYTGPWNARLAAHLLRRAGFGGSPAEIVRFATGTINANVDEMLRFPATDALPPPATDEERPTGMLGTIRRKKLADPAAMSMSMPTSPADDAAAARRRKTFARMRRAQAIVNVTWWLDRMLATPAPLQEKMTLFLHGHFATATNQKGIYGRDIVEQNALLRRYALGNFKALTHDIARDRAMLKWLDGARSDKAHPNENFARELMELYTLGVGNYTENDVRESARAFTGYTFSRRTGEFAFVASRHDDDSKSFLGRTGNFNGDDIVDIIFAQPAASIFLARKLLEFFVYSDPEPELVADVATALEKHDFELKPVVATLLRSNVFYSERAYRALVKSPVEFVVGSYRLFGTKTISPQTLAVLGRMGQIPFRPPSVKGWDGGAAWLNTQTVLARENFASALMSAQDGSAAGGIFGDRPSADAPAAARRLVDAILQGDASPAAFAKLEAYLNGRDTSANGALSGENFEERMRGAAYLVMAMPAYQLS
jgi:uncharacterized protein (DUF1800 family)